MEWFTSDLHLGHTNIMKYCPWRPGETIEEMNAILIQNILDTVKRGDQLVIAGDAVMGDRKENLKLLQPIVDAGVTLTLVAGNHDNVHPMNRVHEKWAPVYREVFSHIFTTARYRWESPLDLRFEILVGHLPLTLSEKDDRRYNREDFDKYVVSRETSLGCDAYLHGHIHSEDAIIAVPSPELRTPLELHIGVDADWTEFGVQRFHPINKITIMKAIEKYALR